MGFGKSILAAAFVVFSVTFAAQAQPVYKWVDEQGNTHFTTLYKNIPPEFRKGGPKGGKTGVPEKSRETPAVKRAGQPAATHGTPGGEKAGGEPLSFLSEPLDRAVQQDKKRRILFEIEGRYWFTGLDGKVRYTESGIGTSVDFKDDLGVGDENFPEGRFTWHISARNSLRFAYTQACYEGDGNIDRTIEFGGETYTVGTRVVTNVDLKYFRLGWIWDFFHGVGEAVRIGTLLEAKGFWADASLDAPELSPAIKESVEVVGAFPTVGLVCDIRLHRFVDLFAEASGIYAGKYGYSYDCEAGLAVSPIRNLSLIGGWRILDFRVEDDPDFATLMISGPFAGGILRF
ncbi:MAG: DUF4124 domain-containing protein [Deltaproteobacteria bacterium]|nr:DUF4124 domain-containing protein [Deltaproteobacteria bacterium]